MVELNEKALKAARDAIRADDVGDPLRLSDPALDAALGRVIHAYLSALPAPDDGMVEIERFSANKTYGAFPSHAGNYVLYTDHRTTLQSKDEQIERLTRERDVALENYTRAWNERDAQRRRAEAAEQQVQKLTAENERLREALTPSGDTKAAYMGEFSISHEQWNVEGDDTETVHITVPWTTIKEIMAAIKERATINGAKP